MDRSAGRKRLRCIFHTKMTWKQNQAMILNYLRSSRSSLERRISDFRFQGRSVLGSKSKKKIKVLKPILWSKVWRKWMQSRRRHLLSAFVCMVNANRGKLDAQNVTLAGLVRFATYQNRGRKPTLSIRWSPRFSKLIRLMRYMPMWLSFQNPKKWKKLRLIMIALPNHLLIRRMLHLSNSQQQRIPEQLSIILLGCKSNNF